METIKSLCKKLSEHLEQDYPQLQIFWVFYNDEKTKSQAFKDMHYAIDLHSAGPKLIKDYETLNFPENHTRTAHARSYKLDLTFGQLQSCCVVFVKETKNNDTLTMESFCNVLNSLYTILSYYKKPVLLWAEHQRVSAEDEKRLLCALTADIFTALYISLSYSADSISHIAKLRIQEALSANTTPVSSLMFPLAHDLTKTVFREIRGLKEFQQHLSLKRCVELAERIKSKIDLKNIKSWQDFTADARIMAWAGHSPEEILGTAIFSCEDLFKRASAYLAIEVGNLNPNTMTRFEFYNPFTDDDTNARNHKKLCLDYLDRMPVYYGPKQKSEFCISEADRQNEEFSEGKFLGWSAPSFYRLSDFINQERPDEITSRQIQTTFTQFLDATKWNDIKTAGLNIIDMKKEGRKVPPDQIVKMVENQSIS
jgi:hypothetical protein